MTRSRVTALACLSGLAIAVAASCSIGGCTSKPDPSQLDRGHTQAYQNPNIRRVIIGGEPFDLRLARGESEIDRGLSGTTLGKGEGMLFDFGDGAERVFVMKDCPDPLDVLFLDRDGCVVTIHTMKPEPARIDAESANTPEGNQAYLNRLKGYFSGGQAWYAIEIRGGEAARLGVTLGSVLDIGG